MKGQKASGSDSCFRETSALGGLSFELGGKRCPLNTKKGDAAKVAISLSPTATLLSHVEIVTDNALAACVTEHGHSPGEEDRRVESVGPREWYASNSKYQFASGDLLKALQSSLEELGCVLGAWNGAREGDERPTRCESECQRVH